MIEGRRQNVDLKRADLDLSRTRYLGFVSDRRFIGLVLLAVALIGFGQIFLLPPWEGYDEIAHWSYVQELADTGAEPKSGVDRLSQDLNHYDGPLPLSLAHLGNKNPTYQQSRERNLTDLGIGPSTFAQGRQPNWEAQHPPLFYILMVPIYKMSAGWGWKANLLAVRIASWLLALAGLSLAALARYDDLPMKIPVGATAAAWPLIVPEFFPEMARLGNDSLCLLIMSGIWILALRMRRGGLWVETVGIGLLLGFGLLTKVFFVPFGLGTVLMILIVGRPAPRKAVTQAAAVALIACVISLWWYVQQMLLTGSIGGNELAEAGKSGLVANLAHNFDAMALTKSLLAIPMTFVWAGSWSLVAPHAWMIAPLLALPALLAGRSMMSLRAQPLLALPLLFVVPLLAGLTYHLLAWLSLGNLGPGSPGWYLHILAAPLAFALAAGWRNDLPTRLAIVVTAALTIFVWYCEISYFSGCAVPDGSRHLTWAGANCSFSASQLDVLGFPLLGGLALAISMALILVVGLRFRTTLNAIPA